MTAVTSTLIRKFRLPATKPKPVVQSSRETAMLLWKVFLSQKTKQNILIIQKTSKVALFTLKTVS